MASRFGFGSTDGLVITLDTDPIQQYRHITWKPRDIVKFYRKSAVPSFGGVFYDIDGDGNDEFCVCSLSGDLAVYKMDSNCDWNCCCLSAHRAWPIQVPYSQRLCECNTEN